ncbi:MAG: YceI family protein [Parvibaculaceae bacterium]|nr:YceI family protein [Parvibaculaceae bacterium]
MKLHRALVVIAALTVPTFASATEYTLDKSHTYVGFEISHLGFSTTFGRFEDVTGTLSFDEAKPAASKVDVTVETGSLETGFEKRDEHVESPDFLDVKKYPEMTFKSTKVTVTGKHTGTLTGDLTLHGVTKPVTLHVTFNKAGPNPLKPEILVAGFNATGTIKRSDFGITTYVPAIGDEVKLVISTEANAPAK